MPCCNVLFSGAEKRTKRDIHPLTNFSHIWGSLTENYGKPLISRILVWLAKPVPFGRAILSYIPAVAAPCKGAHTEVGSVCAQLTKTFRTRRSSEDVLFSESFSILGLRSKTRKST